MLQEFQMALTVDLKNILVEPSLVYLSIRLPLTSPILNYEKKKTDLTPHPSDQPIEPINLKTGLNLLQSIYKLYSSLSLQIQFLYSLLLRVYLNTFSN